MGGGGWGVDPLAWITCGSYEKTLETLLVALDMFEVLCVFADVIRLDCSVNYFSQLKLEWD